VTRASKPTTQTVSSEGGRKKFLYVGTTETIAKSAPVKGIEPPVVLSDVYPGYFAFWASTCHQRWGILEVDIENLMPDHLAPFNGYTEKRSRRKKLTEEEINQRRDLHLEKAWEQRNKWQESLEACGVVLYFMQIPPHAINKVTTYDAFGKGANSFVTESCIKHNPWEISAPDHRAAYAFNEALTQWLTCSEVAQAKALSNGVKAERADEHLQNRLGLDLYYRRTEKDLHHWWKI